MIQNDECTFDIFSHAVKPVRSAKRDLQMFMKKRAQYTISNLKLPGLSNTANKYRPVKFMEPVENSESLKFAQTKDWKEK